jgi:hypothetical protein
MLFACAAVNIYEALNGETRASNILRDTLYVFYSVIGTYSENNQLYCTQSTCVSYTDLILCFGERSNVDVDCNANINLYI